MPPNPKEKFEFSDTLYRHLKKNGWHQNYVYTFMAPEHQNKRFQYGEVIYGDMKINILVWEQERSPTCKA